jgi:hypothetical protein
MRSHPRHLRRKNINTGRQISFSAHNSQLHKCRSTHCRNWVSAQVWGVVAVATTATCILGLGLEFLCGFFMILRRMKLAFEETLLDLGSILRVF